MDLRRDSAAVHNLADGLYDGRPYQRLPIATLPPRWRPPTWLLIVTGVIVYALLAHGCGR